MEGQAFMAQQVQVLLVDDLDGGVAEETVSFAIDGRAYEIDLSSKNADELRKALSPYQENARKARTVGRKATTRAAGNRERSAEIRAWAKSAGIPVNDRGRIPASVLEKYEAAH
jgi:Lsr2